MPLVVKRASNVAATRRCISCRINCSLGELFVYLEAWVSPIYFLLAYQLRTHAGLSYSPLAPFRLKGSFEACAHQGICQAATGGRHGSLDRSGMLFMDVVNVSSVKHWRLPSGR